MTFLEAIAAVKSLADFGAESPRADRGACQEQPRDSGRVGRRDQGAAGQPAAAAVVGRMLALTRFGIELPDSVN